MVESTMNDLRLRTRCFYETLNEVQEANEDADVRAESPAWMSTLHEFMHASRGANGFNTTIELP